MLAVLCVLVDVMSDILHDEKGLPGLMCDVTVTEIEMIKHEIYGKLTFLYQHI